MSEFSAQLITRTQAYFSKKYGRDISVEEAADILNALADLWESLMAFAEADV